MQSQSVHAIDTLARQGANRAQSYNLLTPPDKDLLLAADHGTIPHPMCSPTLAKDFQKSNFTEAGDRRADVRIAADNVLREHVKLANSRHENLLLRDRANYHRETERNQHAYVRESQSRFMEEVTAVCRKLQRDSTLLELQRLYLQMMIHYKTLDDLTAASQNIENELGSTQFSLMRQEESFADSTQVLIDALERTEGMATNHNLDSLWRSPGSPDSTLPASSLPNVDPLLTVYVDTIGDVKVMRERLVCAIGELNEREAIRGFQADMDVPDGTCLEMVDTTYIRNRHEAETALATAIRVAEDARLACINANVDISRFDNALADEGWFETPSTPSSTATNIPIITPDNFSLMVRDAPEQIAALSGVKSLPNAAHLSESPQKRKRDDRSARIRDWIEEVDSEVNLDFSLLPQLSPQMSSQSLPEFIPTAGGKERAVRASVHVRGRLASDETGNGPLSFSMKTQIRRYSDSDLPHANSERLSTKLDF